MTCHADKLPEPDTHARDTASFSRQTDSTFGGHSAGLLQAAIAERNLRELADISPKNRKLAELQLIADRSRVPETHAGGPVVQLARINIPLILRDPLPEVIDTGQRDKRAMEQLFTLIEEMRERPRGKDLQERTHYQNLLQEFSRNVWGAFASGDYLDGMPVEDFHRPRDPWNDEDDGRELQKDKLGKKRELVGMVAQVVNLAKSLPGELKKLMPHDAIFNMTPEAQLEFCVDQSKGYDAGELAACLYTSYFYKPINAYLRGNLGTDNPEIRALILATLESLEQKLNDDQTIHEVRVFRVECQAEWIGEKAIHDELHFPGYTSTHPSEDGLEGMLQDIGNGAFGTVTKLAVLKFQGRSKLLQPNTKYFPDEIESIIPAGMKTRIEGTKDITLYIPGKGETPAKEYTLKILPSDEDAT